MQTTVCWAICSLIPLQQKYYFILNKSKLVCLGIKATFTVYRCHRKFAHPQEIRPYPGGRISYIGLSPPFRVSPPPPLVARTNGNLPCSYNSFHSNVKITYLYPFKNAIFIQELLQRCIYVHSVRCFLAPAIRKAILYSVNVPKTPN